jgi:hypothetical protein
VCRVVVDVGHQGGAGAGRDRVGVGGVPGEGAEGDDAGAERHATEAGQYGARGRPRRTAGRGEHAHGKAERDADDGDAETVDDRAEPGGVAVRGEIRVRQLVPLAPRLPKHGDGHGDRAEGQQGGNDRCPRPVETGRGGGD